MIKRIIEVSGLDASLSLRDGQVVVKRVRSGDPGKIEAHIPPEGEVRVLELTSKQFERMRIFYGKLRKEPEKEVPQLAFF